MRTFLVFSSLIVPHGISEQNNLIITQERDITRTQRHWIVTSHQDECARPLLSLLSSLCRVCRNYWANITIFRKKCVWRDMFLDIFPRQLVNYTFVTPRRIKMYIGLRVIWLLSFSYFNQIRILLTVLVNILDIKFHENPSSGRRVFPCGERERERERETDGSTVNLMTNFDNFANAPEHLRRI